MDQAKGTTGPRTQRADERDFGAETCWMKYETPDVENLHLHIADLRSD